MKLGKVAKALWSRKLVKIAVLAGLLAAGVPALEATGVAEILAALVV